MKVRLAMNLKDYHDLAKVAENERGKKTSISKAILRKLLVDNNCMYRACLDTGMEIIEP